MASQKSYSSYLSALAKQQAKALREAETRRKRLEEDAKKLAKLAEKQKQQQYLEAQIEDVNDKNHDVNPEK